MAKSSYVRDQVPLSRFGVLVAQLESIVASAAHKRPDPLLCFDLLSDLINAIDEEPKVLTFISLHLSFWSRPNLLHISFTVMHLFVWSLFQLFGLWIVNPAACSKLSCLRTLICFVYVHSNQNLQHFVEFCSFISSMFYIICFTFML